MMTSKTSASATMRPGKGDLLAGGAVRVAGAVPALVVVADGVGPGAEPGADGDELAADERVLPERLPLLVGGLAGLVEDLGCDRELADVVEEGGPVEPVEVGLGELEPLADHHGVGADALGVAARDAVVAVERGGEDQEPLGRLLRGARLAGLARDRDAVLEPLEPAGAQGELEARGGLVGEDEREPQERGQRQQPPREPVDGPEDEAREGAEPDPPAREVPHRPGRRLHHTGDDADEHDRDEERDDDHRHPHGAGRPQVARPACGRALRFFRHLWEKSADRAGSSTDSL